MIQTTKETYLRKRLLRLLNKQRLDLKNGLPEGITVDRERRTEVRADIKRVINTIEFEDVSVRMITEPFIRLALRTSNTHIYSQRSTIAIVMAIVDDLLSDETGNAYREHTVDMFRISWVSKATRKRHKMRKRSRAI